MRKTQAFSVVEFSIQNNFCKKTTLEVFKKLSKIKEKRKDFMLQKILNFLFGKKPDIFDSKGQPFHLISKRRQKWEDKYRVDAEYNWHDHSGFKGEKRLDGSRK